MSGDFKNKEGCKKMSKMKEVLIGGLVVCIGLVGCGSKEKKNLVGATGGASAVKSQAASKQSEAATVQGLSALQAVFQALNSQGQKSQNAVSKLAPSLGPALTVDYSWKWSKDAGGHYVFSRKDHRGSTYVFKMKQESDWWDGGYYGTPWRGKQAGDTVRDGYTTLIEYDAPLDGVKATGKETTYQIYTLKSFGTSSYYDPATGQYVNYDNVWPDWNSVRVETSGEGRTDNSNDGTWLTYTHAGTAGWSYTSTSTTTYDLYGYPTTNYTWSWTTWNKEKMNFTLSTGYSGVFDVSADQSYSSGSSGTNYDTYTFTQDFKVVTDGKLLKDSEEVAKVHIEARNVVDGMRVEGYYTIPEENHAVKHDLDSSKYGFLSKDMFKSKGGQGSMN